MNRKEERTKIQQHSFQPQINQASALMAKRSRSRQMIKRQLEIEMEKSSGYGDQSNRRKVNLSKSSHRSSRLGSARALSNHKSPLVQRLVQPILTNKWYKKELQKKEEKEIEGCTFKPKISARSNEMNKHSSNIKSQSNLHSREKPLDIFKKANLNYNRRKYSR